MDAHLHPRRGRSARVRRLARQLQDERSGRVVFVSHCLLNQNTRYLGGAFDAGVAKAAVDSYVSDGTGLSQMPCPEQTVWGGVLKRHLLALYGQRWLHPVVRPLLPLLIGYIRIRYRLLAERVADQIVDYRCSGLEVAGVVGVDGSPSCGAATTLDLGRSLDAVMRCPLSRFDGRFMSESVIEASIVPGRGIFVHALGAALARHGCETVLLAQDPQSGRPGSSPPTGPVRVGMIGASRTT